MKLWEKFSSMAKGKPAAAELRAARGEFENERTRLVAEIEQGNSRKAGILKTEGPAGLKQFQEKVRGLADELEALDLAISEIDAKIIEADRLEQAVAFERRAADAAVAMANLTKTRATFFRQVEELLGTIEVGKDLLGKVHSFNIAAATAGKSEQKVADKDMAELLATGRASLGIGHPMADEGLVARLKAAVQFLDLQRRLRTAA